MATTLSQTPSTSLFEPHAPKDGDPLCDQVLTPVSKAPRVVEVKVTDPGDFIVATVFDSKSLPVGVPLSEIAVGFGDVINLELRGGVAKVTARKGMDSADDDGVTAAFKDCMRVAKENGASAVSFDLAKLSEVTRGAAVLSRMILAKATAEENGMTIGFENIPTDTSLKIEGIFRMDPHTLRPKNHAA